MISSQKNKLRTAYVGVSQTAIFKISPVTETHSDEREGLNVIPSNQIAVFNGVKVRRHDRSILDCCLTLTHCVGVWIDGSLMTKLIRVNTSGEIDGLFMLFACTVENAADWIWGDASRKLGLHSHVWARRRKSGVYTLKCRSASMGSTLDELELELEFGWPSLPQNFTGSRLWSPCLPFVLKTWPRLRMGYPHEAEGHGHMTLGLRPACRYESDER